jgi:hypothetical protein
VDVQNGIHVYSVGLKPLMRDVFDAGRMYTFPDLERHITVFPLGVRYKRKGVVT